MLKVGLGRSLLFLEGCWVGPLLTPQPGGMAVQEEEGEECSKGLSAPRSTHRRGTASPAGGGLGAAIWRARRSLPHRPARVLAGVGRGSGSSPILRSNKHKYTEIIHGSGDLS